MAQSLCRASAKYLWELRARRALPGLLVLRTTSVKWNQKPRAEHLS